MASRGCNVPRLREPSTGLETRWRSPPLSVEGRCLGRIQPVRELGCRRSGWHTTACRRCFDGSRGGDCESCSTLVQGQLRLRRNQVPNSIKEVALLPWLLGLTRGHGLWLIDDCTCLGPHRSGLPVRDSSRYGFGELGDLTRIGRHSRSSSSRFLSLRFADWQTKWIGRRPVLQATNGVEPDPESLRSSIARQSERPTGASAGASRSGRTWCSSLWVACGCPGSVALLIDLGRHDVHRRVRMALGSRAWLVIGCGSATGFILGPRTTNRARDTGCAAEAG